MNQLIPKSLVSSIVILMLNGAIASHAQNLPRVQTTGIKAPLDIKIDGKPTEWPQFEAYNNATEFFYTLSNDSNNLYLVVQATYHGIIQKIIDGGVTLSLKSTEKGSNIPPVEITYPDVIVPYDEGVSSTLRNNKTLSEKQLSALNKRISEHIKEIPLNGAKGIDNGKISIYNDFGITAIGLIDDKKVYTYELALPLKYISQVIDAEGKFSYRMTVNGLITADGKHGIIVGGRSSDPSASAIVHDSMGWLTSPTYLDGTYELVK
ncbi:hypothetical protein [Mucilaginibacter sp. HD30]